MANNSISHASGIYIIVNIKNGKVYIGKAKDLHRRWNDHKRMLNEGTHFNHYLQFAWNKYKEKSFQFKILEYCPIEQLNEREIHHIAIYRGRNLAYNLTNGGDGLSVVSEEIRLKISNGMKGKTRSAETRLKMSESAKGKPRRSEEHQRKLNEAQRGKIVSEETRRKQSEAAKKRPPVSEETRHKMSDALKGNTHMVGKHPSEETLLKRGESIRRAKARKRMEREQDGNS